MSEASYDLFTVFLYNVFILKFSNYPVDQKNKSEWKMKKKALSNAEKGILWSAYPSHIFDPHFLHHLVCSLKALDSISTVCSIYIWQLQTCSDISLQMDRELDLLRDVLIQQELLFPYAYDYVVTL